MSAKITPNMIHALRCYARGQRATGGKGNVMPASSPRTEAALIRHQLVQHHRPGFIGTETHTRLTRKGWTALLNVEHGLAKVEDKARAVRAQIAAESSPRMPIGKRGEIHEQTPRHEGWGVSRTWRRDINGVSYSFNVVTMPDGEIRWFVNKFNGYVGGKQFACAWDRAHAVTFKPAPASPSADERVAAMVAQLPGGGIAVTFPTTPAAPAYDPHWSCGVTAIPCPDGTCKLASTPKPFHGFKVVAHMPVVEGDGHMVVCDTGTDLVLFYAWTMDDTEWGSGDYFHYAGESAGTYERALVHAMRAMTNRAGWYLAA